MLTEIIGYATYAALGLMALWGAFCCITVWRRVAGMRFKSEPAQEEFLDAVEQPLVKGDFDGASELCQDDARAVPQLVLLALVNRKLGYVKCRQVVEDRFQRDILADLEHRLSWVNTVIKSAPMVGLFGTVTGMMGAFAKLATAENVDPTALADDISFALITTASGLAIAIPLLISIAAVNIRIRKMEELAVAGINRFLEMLQPVMTQSKKG